MNSTCSCVSCSGRVAMRLQAKLNSIQRDMLGFFCAKCILAKCGATHKVIR